MSYRVSLGYGRFTSGRVDAIYAPTTLRRGPVVVYLHSAAGFANEGYPTSSFQGPQAHIRYIVENLGYTVVVPNQPTLYGNGDAEDTGASTCQGVLTDAIAYHRAHLLGTDDPVVLLGTSMGSTTALRRAGLTPDEVACVVGFLTVPDLTIVYDNVDNLFDTVDDQVAAAYGVTQPNPLPENTCPVNQLTDSVPKLITHASDDPYTTTEGHEVEATMATGRGATFLDVGALGHTDAAIQAVPLATVANFIGEHTS